ncbi:MAG: carbon-nitrogen hydrolase family protein [Planctomycetota bacterium]
MKLCVAQLRPVAGNIQSNVVAHVRLIELAVASGAEIVVFPELSMTGYDRARARDLAVDLEDRRLDVFQTISDTQQITIGIGVPTKHRNGVCISLMLFQPHQSKTLYSKMHLHSGEEACFVPGPPATGLVDSHPKVALAICYEASVSEHAANAVKNGASVYLASFAYTVGGIDKGLARLSEIAREYSMTVLMSNCIGRSESWEWAGRTSAWNSQGVLLSQLDDEYEGIIVIDTETQDVVQLQP